MFEAKLHIRDAGVGARDGAVFERLSPVSGQPVTRAVAAGPRDARDAANASAAAFPVWRATSVEEKRKVLARARDLLIEHTEEFVEIAAEELGSTPDWIRFNVSIAVDVFNEAMKIPEKITQTEETSEKSGIQSTVFREPVGAVLAIAPWNAPVTLAVRAIVWPLACGNTVVFKGSELCPMLHSRIVDVICEAGLPAGALTSVIHAPEMAEPVVDALAGHPAVRRVNFTGSTRVGRRVADICARHLKPCLLELSGKAPLIVLEDADLAAAAKAAAYGAYFNQGQICMATERMIVVDAVADPFRAEMEAQCAELLTRKNRDKVGELISAEAARRVGRLIEDALSKGATLIAGGEVSGSYVVPTLLDRVTPEMQIYGEESFGPVAAIIRAGDEAEAISIANDTQYGLVASVFTADTSRARALAGLLETGVCHINGPTVYDDPSKPFGGVKTSGYGRFGGTSAIHEFTELRWITVQEPRSDYPFWT
ncbi:aldehyde dehydrogenase family protein [Maritimibacter sp. UBA3975]|uniref:aldehyde dehydrogenase family protein n=1 Tax=Maritimibacter sp. UBA3975 TaxID=1946833 RepID=UPI000C0A178F|nr:aldehyde dehydrogenase family protein [Maritimibacter sp. UBA3975]MAM61542.1 dehydrogenase [Maritimibacter sp.]|tara:strand:+ start:28074 stop:29522 length:1449 start_codon:yes stop_codon:yes gene_type:complete